MASRFKTRPRTWFALGYGGNGITFSVVAAQAIRDEILGHPNPDAELFGFGRLARANAPQTPA